MRAIPIFTVPVLCAWPAVVLAYPAKRTDSPSTSLTPPLFPLQQDAGSPALFPTPSCGSFHLEEATIDEMQAAMANGSLTSQQLVTCYMLRTYQTNPYINSLMQTNPDVLAIAAQMDEERAAGLVRGPLHGIPFTVKDNIATKDNLETTAGSWALLGSIVPRDAFVVKRLREAGAVLFGKATMSEWADMRSNRYSEGYSPRGGQARSPYNLTRNPGGSSSGSAAGVAANAIAFSIGTETDGSVISPAERNGVVGFKPTVGLTSRSGVVPESEHQDTVGTFGRTVRDATYALDATYGIDSRDNYTFDQEGRTPHSGYAQFLTNQTSLRGAVFGLPWNSFWKYADTNRQMVLLSVIELMQSAGAIIVNETEILDYETIVSNRSWDWDWGTKRGYPNESEYTVVKVDFYNNIHAYLSELNNTNVKTLEDIIQFNYDNDGTEGGCPYSPAVTNCSGKGIPAFASGQDGLQASLATGGIRNETYWQALSFCQGKTRQGIDWALQGSGRVIEGGKARLDGLLVPSHVGQSYQIAAQAGYPMITIPAGVNPVDGMPFGLAIMHTAWAEPELVKWASAIEDLQQTYEDWQYRRTLPEWRSYLRRNIPVR